MSPERQDCSQQQSIAVDDDEYEDSENRFGSQSKYCNGDRKIINSTAYYSVPLTADEEIGDLS